jgi:hypothetical protein
MVITKKIQMPVKTEEVKAEDTKSELSVLQDSVLVLTEKVNKIEGSYDGGYGAPNDKLPPPAASKSAEVKEDAVPGVPGTHAEEKGGYDSKYVEGNDHKEPDGDEPDGDECECSYCKGTGKMKKTKKPDVVEEETKPEEPEKKEHSLDFGQMLPLFKPTKEELNEAKSVKFNKNEVFGIRKRENNSMGRQMNEWAIAETQRLTPKK